MFRKNVFSTMTLTVFVLGVVIFSPNIGGVVDAIPTTSFLAENTTSSSIAENDGDLGRRHQHHPITPVPASKWNLTTAIEMLYWSKCAYCPAEDLMDWTCGNCYNETTAKFLPYYVSDGENKDHVQAFVGFDYRKNRTIISFRGSDNLMNWLADLSFMKLDSPFDDKGCMGCRVHKGFLTAYLGVRDEIIEAVHKVSHDHPSNAIWITGHSLGGALAVHCALDLVVNYNMTQVNSLTFGEPRVGNLPWAAFYSKNVPHSVRVVHQSDPVPHFPQLLQGFFHEPLEVWNTGDGTDIKICNGSGEDPTCSDSLPRTHRNINDHLWYLGMPTGCGK